MIMRTVKDWDNSLNSNVYRCDSVFGSVVTRPEWGVRILEKVG